MKHGTSRISNPGASSPEAALREEVDGAPIGDMLIPDGGSKGNTVIVCIQLKMTQRESRCNLFHYLRSPRADFIHGVQMPVQRGMWRNTPDQPDHVGNHQ